ATGLASDIPKSNLWASDPNGIDQVGCVYTAQGFEFDYVGVIFGLDLVYDFDKQRWVGNKDVSEDYVVKRSKDQFLDLVKNTYRVLLSRGMKGCYVYFMDKDTERFFKSRIE
ncbi:MAG: DNA/RNA helicase domain-containing protein, partial [Candidatus Natronoplasma sp.]